MLGVIDWNTKREEKAFRFLEQYPETALSLLYAYTEYGAHITDHPDSGNFKLGFRVKRYKNPHEVSQAFSDIQFLRIHLLLGKDKKWLLAAQIYESQRPLCVQTQRHEKFPS